MGKLANDMATLVERVRSSAGSRRSGLKETRRATRSQLKGNRRERHQRARSLAAKAQALGTKMEQQNQERKQAAWAFHGHLKEMAAARCAALGAARLSTRTRLGGCRFERGQKGQQFRTALRGEVTDTRAAVGFLRSAVRAMMSAIGADVREATRLWRRGRK